MDLNKHLNNDTKSLTKLLHKFGFTVHEHEKSIYSKNFDDYIIFCLYVDDILTLETSLDAIQRVKDYLSLNFDM